MPKFPQLLYESIKYKKNDGWSLEKWAQFDSEFELLFREAAESNNIDHLEGLLKKFIEEYIQEFKVQDCKDSMSQVKTDLNAGITLFKRDSDALAALTGVNATYYWDPLYCIDIELYFCCKYISDKNKWQVSFDYYSSGFRDKVTIPDLAQFGFPEDSDSYEGDICDKYLRIMLFQLISNLLQKEKLDYVPFSVSSCSGHLDAEQPALSKVEIPKSVQTKFSAGRVTENERLRQAYKTLENDKEFNAYAIGDGEFAVYRRINDEGQFSNYLSCAAECLIDAAIKNNPDPKTNKELTELIEKAIVGAKAKMGDQGFKKPIKPISDEELLIQLRHSNLKQHIDYFKKTLEASNA